MFWQLWVEKYTRLEKDKTVNIVWKYSFMVESIYQNSLKVIVFFNQAKYDHLQNFNLKTRWEQSFMELKGWQARSMQERNTLCD